MAAFPPITHVALTVRDLSVSVPWYEALLSADPVLDEDTDPDFHHTVYLIGDGQLFGLHQHVTPAPDEQFSEFRLGLDHVAFGCANRQELEEWVRRLDELGIAHGGIKDRTYGLGLSFRDPDGIALEFFAPPGWTRTCCSAQRPSCRDPAERAPNVYTERRRWLTQDPHRSAWRCASSSGPPRRVKSKRQGLLIR